MCGFAGVIAWDERYRVSRETLAKMSAAIAHRGPDGEGFHINQDQNITPENPQVALAFRRLAILDPDPRSNQPFTDGRHWLVFNGEIYNFRELKKELSILRPDYQWRTTGDTEVLLCAYGVWGEKCVEHLNGMFAFAVWDTVEKSLFLARDRMGQKPLYVVQSAGSVHFGSEATVVPKHHARDGMPMFWMCNYFRYGCFADSVFWWPASRQIQPGGREFYRGGSRPERSDRYFDSGLVVGERHDDGTAVSMTRSLIHSAVQKQLISDVPLGVFLSGGVDSSIIAAVARKSGPLKTFSVRFDDPRYDESEYARIVAEHIGSEHHEFKLSPDAVTDLPKLAAAFGVPFADSSTIPTLHLSEQTRTHVKVALSGDGGDELFGGYDRYRAMKWTQRGLLSHIGRFSERHRKVAAIFFGLARICYAVSKNSPKHPLTRAGRFLDSIRWRSAERYDQFLRIFDDKILAELWPGLMLMGANGIGGYNLASHRHRDPVQAALACDRMHYLPEDLLLKVDRCSMMHGLEVRSPFMDHELVQFAAGLTTDQLLKGGPKRMLREAFKDDLPAWVFKRKKMGFAVPIGDWFRGELRGMLRDTLFSSHAFGRSHFDMKVVERLVEEHESRRVDHSQRLYALLMLELWWDTVRSAPGVSA